MLWYNAWHKGNGTTNGANDSKSGRLSLEQPVANSSYGPLVEKKPVANI